VAAVVLAQELQIKVTTEEPPPEAEGLLAVVVVLVRLVLGRKVEQGLHPQLQEHQ